MAVAFDLLIIIVVLTLVKVDYFATPRITGEGYYIGNLHTHTSGSDGQMSYHQAIEVAKALGLDFIAITDHDTVSFATRFLCPIDKRILCIVGEEVSTKDGHILAIGITNIIPPDLSAEETIKRIHEQGGVAIPAHPGGPNGLAIEMVKRLPALDAIECSPYTKSEKYNYSCELLPNFPYVYNSDAHRADELDRMASRCWLANLSVEALKEAIQAGSCSEFRPGDMR